MFARAPNSRSETMENLIVGGIALLLFAYLVVAMLRPEIF